MGNPTTVGVADEKSLIERLRADYDVAFRNWAAQVRVLQSVDSGDPRDSEAVAQARSWVEEAAAIYREKRNLLLNHVIASRSRQGARGTLNISGETGPARGPRADRSASSEDANAVRKLARQIWEEAGRPDGTAEEDWHRAEEILQTRR